MLRHTLALRCALNPCRINGMAFRQQHKASSLTRAVSWHLPTLLHRRLSLQARHEYSRLSPRSIWMPLILATVETDPEPLLCFVYLNVASTHACIRRSAASGTAYFSINSTGTCGKLLNPVVKPMPNSPLSILYKLPPSRRLYSRFERIQRSSIIRKQ